MTVVPKEDRDTDTEIKRFIRKAVDFILLHKVYRRSRGSDKPIKKEYELLTFPLTYYDDVLGILESLLFFRIKGKAIDDAVRFILAKENKNGRWLLEKTVSSSSMHAKVEKQGEESKWITYRALNLLKKHAEISAD